MDFRSRDGTEQLPVAEAPEDVAALYSWANLHGAKYKDLSAPQQKSVSRTGEEPTKTTLQAASSEGAFASQGVLLTSSGPQAEPTGPSCGTATAHAKAKPADSMQGGSEARARGEARMPSPIATSASTTRAEARLSDPPSIEGHEQGAEAGEPLQGGTHFDRPTQGPAREASGPQQIAVESPGTHGAEGRVLLRERQGDKAPMAEYTALNPASSSMYTRRSSDTPGRPEQPLTAPPQRPARANPRSFFNATGEGLSRGRRVTTAMDSLHGDDLQVGGVPMQGGVRTESSNIFSVGANLEVLPRGASMDAIAPFPLRTGVLRDSPVLERDTQAARTTMPGTGTLGPGSSHLSSRSVPAAPAWIYSTESESDLAESQYETPALISVADTLQHSRERVASRWFALKGVFEHPGRERERDISPRQKEVRTPVLAIFSLSGGVGKTSLVATLGRSLSSLGEKVLLADTTSHGLLPYYFGASELRQGVVRTFSPPSGSTDAPIYLVSYDLNQHANETSAQEGLVEEIASHGRGTHRMLIDLSPSAGWVFRHMTRLDPTLLVPVAADMNSVITLQAVEKFTQGMTSADGQPIRPYYLLNQFDAALPLHLDVREVLRRQLGDRLLPFVIRRATAVSEALAEGMTILDYAPDAPVVEDYETLATWLRNVAAPATAGFRNVRWSER